MGLSHSPKIVTNGLVLALDAANNKSYPRSGTVWSSGWAGSFSNPTYSFDGNLSTSTFQSGTATYTFAGGGLSVSGTVRIYVSFGASSGQVSGLPNVIVVDGTDVSSKMAAANVYTTGVGAGWIDITTEVGAVFNTIVMTGTGGRSNPSIYAIEVNGQILIDAVAVTTWTDLSGNSNNGTLTNGPTFSSANGGCIVFDGTNDYVITSAIVEAATNSNLQTICGWMIGDGSLFGSNSNSTGQFHLKVSLISNVLTYRVSYYGGTGVEGDDTVSVTSRSANNIVVVKTAAEKYDVYFNASKVLSQVTKKANVSVNFYPGYYYGGSWNGGTVSNYSIYNRALTASEILQNYNATKSRFGL